MASEPKINYLTMRQKYNLLQNEDLFGSQLLDKDKKFIKNYDIPKEISKYSYLKVRDTLFEIPDRYEMFTFYVNGRDLKVFGTPEQAEENTDAHTFGYKKVLFKVGEITKNINWGYSTLNRLGMHYQRDILTKDLTGKNVRVIYYNGEWIPVKETKKDVFTYNLYTDMLDTLTTKEDIKEYKS